MCPVPGFKCMYCSISNLKVGSAYSAYWKRGLHTCILCTLFCIFCILLTIYSNIIKTCILLANSAYIFAYIYLHFCLSILIAYYAYLTYNMSYFAYNQIKLQILHINLHIILHILHIDFSYILCISCIWNYRLVAYYFAYYHFTHFFCIFCI